MVFECDLLLTLGLGYLALLQGTCERFCVYGTSVQFFHITAIIISVTITEVAFPQEYRLFKVIVNEIKQTAVILHLTKKKEKQVTGNSIL